MPRSYERMKALSYQWLAISSSGDGVPSAAFDALVDNEEGGGVVMASGLVATVQFSDGESGTSASLGLPFGLSATSDGAVIYMGDRGNNIVQSIVLNASVQQGVCRLGVMDRVVAVLLTMVMHRVKRDEECARVAGEGMSAR